jgi:AcrR family transcriptional regulator
MTIVIADACYGNYDVRQSQGRKASPREQMIRSAVRLMRERGVEATSFSEVLAHSGAPRGSIYHHFPGGKAQLIEEATRYGGEFIAAGAAAALEQDDPVAALDGFAQYWRTSLRHSDFSAGCPVAAATLEGDRAPNARDAASQAFNRWEKLFSKALQRKGIPRTRARSLGTLVVAAVEGAIILARAERSSAPIERVANELHTVLHDALMDHRPR